MGEAPVAAPSQTEARWSGPAPSCVRQCCGWSFGHSRAPRTERDCGRSPSRSSCKSRVAWELLREANKQTDLAERAALLRRAEQLLVEEDVTIAPLYFYAGFNYYRTNELAGIYPNVIDQHPLNAIRWLAGGAR